MIEINLLPEEFKARKLSADSKYGFAAYIAAGIFALLIILHVCLLLLNLQRGMQLSSLNAKLKKLEPQKQMVDKFIRGEDAIPDEARAVQELLRQRINWSEKLNLLSLDLSAGIWFKEITVSPGGLIIHGLAVSVQKEEMQLINKYMNNLKKDPAFYKDFSGLELNSVRRESIGGCEVVNFVLVATLNPRQ